MCQQINQQWHQHNNQDITQHIKVSFYITWSGSFIFDSDDNDDGTIDSQHIDHDDFIIVEEILTVAIDTILDEKNIEYDSLSINVETLSTKEVKALVVISITNAMIKNDNLIEIVETSIIVEIENEGDSGDANFIIADVETETAQSNTKLKQIQIIMTKCVYSNLL